MSENFECPSKIEFGRTQFVLLQMDLKNKLVTLFCQRKKKESVLKWKALSKEKKWNENRFTRNKYHLEDEIGIQT